MQKTTVASPAAQAARNPLEMLNQFNKFRQQMVGKNPRQMVEQLVQSGQMSQEQFHSLEQQANSFISMLKR